MTDHEKMLIEELEKRLLWYREEASEAEFDAEEVDAICTMLQKLSPEEPHRSKEETYGNIMRLVSLEEEAETADERDAAGDEAVVDGDGERSAGDGRGEAPAEPDGGKKLRFPAGKRGLRAAIVFLAAAGIFASLNMATYARENKSLFTMILERAGWVKIEKEPEAGSSVIGNDRLAEAFYDSWGDLDRGVKERITVPAYIPEGYSLYGVKYWDREFEIVIKSNYYDQGNGHLLFEINLWEDNADHYRETVMDETIYTLLSEYSDENTFYYAYEDEYICMAFIGNNFYRISGNISLEEMRKIRGGLGSTIR